MESLKQGQRIFHAKTKVTDGQWDFRGTVVLRNDGRGGVLYLRTGRKDADGRDEQEVIALFARREEAIVAAA
jgi:hypothetical protein